MDSRNKMNTISRADERGWWRTHWEGEENEWDGRGVRLTGSARNLLSEGLALVSPRLVNQQIFAGQAWSGNRRLKLKLSVCRTVVR
jgi:hypothetical protein